VNWITIAFFLVTTGVAADNLVLAGLSGCGFSIFRHHKWVLILLLCFIIQNEMLILGRNMGEWTQGWLQGQQQWVAIGIFMSMGIKMFQELQSSIKETGSTGLATRNFLMLNFSTSFYVFAFGCAVHWLRISDSKARIAILLLIGVFLIAGLFLGKNHCDKLLKTIHTLTVLFVLIGAVILFIEKFNWPVTKNQVTWRAH
jgi:putative Mn2+ efflux pump MntP